MKKRISLVLIIAVVCIGCKQSKKPTEIYGKVKPEIKKEAFSEGLLTYELSISDSIVDTFIKDKVAQAPTNIKALLDKYKGKPEDKKYIENFFENNPDFLKRYGKLPFIKNTVSIAGYNVNSYREGLTYLYELEMNELQGQGSGFIGRNRSMLSPEQGVNFSIRKEQVEQIDRHFLIVIDENNYTREERETDMKVAGYEVKEVLYQLKEELRHTADLCTPLELTVYTSKGVSALVNSALPVQLPREGYGVLKAEVRFRDSSVDPFYFVIEAKAVVVRELLMGEKSIVNYSKEFTALDESNSNELYKAVFEKYIIEPTMNSK
ncbi:hypothetical protein NWE55_02620 [Myroides albus]|uniref:Uncharacterized protein n=1 Tax=Myroides albus TaxID=2562892 RepID=A0A6I3LT86_9FLAO|nr:hypothetical protein [Myroides albus]MTG99175.1 hypothetical protein [Myroides albus]UVD80199.1 hypothetical protein NWE55_02620 [Myroides albus]